MSNQPPPGGPSYAAPPNSSMALVSLISGILGISFIPIVGSIVAVITGSMARKEIRESYGALGGDGLATAGLVLGWIGIGLTVIGLCVGGAFILVPICLALFAASTQQSSLILPVLLAAL
jgi:hypothetical protein